MWIPEEGIHCLSCNYPYTKDKMSAAEKHIDNNETIKQKKGKKRCELIELL